MKKNYEPPLAKLLLLCATDILTGSPEDDLAEDDLIW